MNVSFPLPNRLRKVPRGWQLIMSMGVLGVVLMLMLIPRELESVRQQLIGFPDSHVPTEWARPWLLAMICLLPALGAWLYTLGDTLDRYISRHFLSMFGICICALYSIWLLIDLSDNLSEFRSSGKVLSTILVYHVTRLPAVLMLLLPYALLLSLLESMGKLSTNREIIAIIQSGRSVLRLCLPLVVAGACCTLLAIGINYHWAPVAEGSGDDILTEASGGAAREANKVLYRNLRTERLWMVGSFPPDYQKGRPLEGVEVTTTNEQDQLVSRLSADTAQWDPATGVWTFENAVTCHYEAGRAPYYEVADGPLLIEDWPETPWQIIKPGLSAEFLGVPELNAWLDTHKRFPQIADPAPYLTHRHYRFALPFTCLITVLLATPLAIHFSRRGSGGGMFLAVVLSFLMMLVNTIILAFGESGHLAPALAAWLPNLLFGSLGAYLLHRRITGRSIHDSIRRLLAIS